MRANPRTQPWRSYAGRTFPAPYRRRRPWWRRNARLLAVLCVAAALAVFARPETGNSWTRLLPAFSGKAASAPRNCAEARARGLANARRGQPGYAPWLDADNDGIACEPYRRR